MALIARFLNNNDDECQFSEYQCGINHTFEPKVDTSLELYAINGVQTAANFLALSNFTLDQFLNLATPFCSLTWEEVQTNPVWREDPFVASDYFLLLYTY